MQEEDIDPEGMLRVKHPNMDQIFIWINYIFLRKKHFCHCHLQ